MAHPCSKLHPYSRQRSCPHSGLPVPDKAQASQSCRWLHRNMPLSHYRILPSGAWPPAIAERSLPLLMPAPSGTNCTLHLIPLSLYNSLNASTRLWSQTWESPVNADQYVNSPVSPYPRPPAPWTLILCRHLYGFLRLCGFPFFLPSYFPLSPWWTCPPMQSCCLRRIRQCTCCHT